MEIGDCFWFEKHIAMKINEVDFHDNYDDYYCYTAIDLETTQLLELDPHFNYELIPNVKLTRE